MLMPHEAAGERERMVAHQLVPRGILDQRVIAAMRSVPREHYVPGAHRDAAYADRALSIECDQTISQPYVVAAMAELLRLHGHERVLEIGTGSGYAAAVLARLAREVWSIEWHEPLARGAAERLRRDGCHNVAVRCGDGAHGWREVAPFDAITVAAGAPEVPGALLQQLAIGGRLVMPVGPPDDQQLVRVVRHATQRFATERLFGVRFVPLLGAASERSHSAGSPW